MGSIRDHEKNQINDQLKYTVDISKSQENRHF